LLLCIVPWEWPHHIFFLSLQVEQKARQEDEQRRAEEEARVKAEADAAEAELVQAALSKGASSS